MARERIGRNAGHSGRIDLSESELNELVADIGDGVDVDVVETRDGARAVIDSSDSE